MDYSYALNIIGFFLNIGIIFLTRPKCREEDEQHSTFGNLKIRKSTTWRSTTTAYFLLPLWVVSTIICCYQPLLTPGMFLPALCIPLTMLLCAALLNRKSYYTVDDRQITFVNSGKVEWSISWDEIKCVKKRFKIYRSRKGRTYDTVYDIQKKDGETIPDLPCSLGSDFEKYVFVDKDEYDEAFREWWLFPALLLVILLCFAIHPAITKLLS